MRRAAASPMTAGLIIAAGRTGSGGGFAPLQMTGVVSAVQRLILTLRQAGVDEIVLVTDDSARLEKHVAHMGAVLLTAPSPQAEMLAGVQQGLAYLPPGFSRVLITPVDVPLFTAQTVAALLGSGAVVASPTFGGKAGHPLLLGRALFQPVIDYTGGGGLRGALQAAGAQRCLVPVQDEGVLLNIQRTQDFAELVQRHSLRRLRPQIKLRLAREQAFYGPGTQQLLRLIQNTGSVREACRLMGISYSKGWKMIALMEQELGAKVVDRKPGGAQGGGASLTPQGEELLTSYQAFCAECETLIERCFEKHFPSGQQKNEE